jgi:hypothetical protein
MIRQHPVHVALMSFVVTSGVFSVIGSVICVDNNGRKITEALWF